MEKSGQKPSFGQGLELVNIAIKAIINALKKNNPNLKKIQEIISKPGVIFDFFEKLLAESVEVKPSILKLISGGEKIIIEALDGKEFIYGSNDVFKSDIDEDFKNWGLNKSGPATTETQLDVYEIVDDGTFIEMFACISDDLEKIVITQEQIKNFCKKHSNWLHQKGYATFFLTKVGDEYFVVCVNLYDDGLSTDVNLLEDGHIWDGVYCHRLVSPRLELLDK